MENLSKEPDHIWQAINVWVVFRKKTDHLQKNSLKKLEVHGDKYDYSKVDYRQNKTGRNHLSQTWLFWQAPNTHISNRAGCKLCLDSKGERAVEVF